MSHGAEALIRGVLASIFVAAVLLQPARADPIVIPGYGFVTITRDDDSPIVGLTAKLVVPAKPIGSGTLFIWPGLQPSPGAERFWPIGNGVLQPVLTWETLDPSCAPGQHPHVNSTWWISAQYVNTLGQYAGYDGCFGGPIMPVDPGDVLLIDMSLLGRVWVQTVFDVQKNTSVSFQINLHRQAQIYAQFAIELDPILKVPDVVFEDVEITFAESKTSNCSIWEQGTRDTVGARINLTRDRKCYIDRIVLREADGATSK